MDQVDLDAEAPADQHRSDPQSVSGRSRCEDDEARKRPSIGRVASGVVGLRVTLLTARRFGDLHRTGRRTRLTHYFWSIHSGDCRHPEGEGPLCTVARRWPWKQATDGAVAAHNFRPFKNSSSESGTLKRRSIVRRPVAASLQKRGRKSFCIRGL